MSNKFYVYSLSLILITSCGVGVAPASYVDFNKELGDVPPQEKVYGQRYEKDFAQNVAEVEKTYTVDSSILSRAIEKSTLINVDERYAMTHKVEVVLDPDLILNESDKYLNSSLDAQSLYSYEISDRNERKLKNYSPYVSDRELVGMVEKIRVCEWIGVSATLKGFEFKYKSKKNKQSDCQSEALEVLISLSKNKFIRFYYWHLLSPDAKALESTDTVAVVQKSTIKTRIVRKVYRVDAAALVSAFESANLVQKEDATNLYVDIALDTPAAFSPTTLRLNRIGNEKEWKQSIYDDASSTASDALYNVMYSPFIAIAQSLGAKNKDGDPFYFKSFRFEKCSNMKVSSSPTGVHFVMDYSNRKQIDTARFPECIEEAIFYTQKAKINFDYVEER